ncbi:ATP-binding protein [Streptomyces sp. NPDC020965]|uniref:ATP-binding protein n=1 Tax=Streptomyces sp. NPDC020965 TaxID=3365105 RepID=UPI0037B9C3D3
MFGQERGEHGAPGGSVRLRIAVANDPSAARKVRDRIAGPVREAHPELVDDVLLCASEVVTNAHRHTGTSVIRVCVFIRRRYVLVRVRDGRAGPLPEAAGAGPGAEHGRGLLLLGAVADAWGGKTVWFRVAARRAATR